MLLACDSFFPRPSTLSCIYSTLPPIPSATHNEAPLSRIREQSLMFLFFCLFLKAGNRPAVPFFFFAFFWHTMRRHKSAELIKAPFESLAHLNSVPSPPPPPLLNHHLLKCSLSRLHLPSFSARSLVRRSATLVSLLCVNPPASSPPQSQPQIIFQG